MWHLATGILFYFNYKVVLHHIKICQSTWLHYSRWSLTIPQWHKHFERVTGFPSGTHVNVLFQTHPELNGQINFDLHKRIHYFMASIESFTMVNSIKRKRMAICHFWGSIQCVYGRNLIFLTKLSDLWTNRNLSHSFMS